MTQDGASGMTQDTLRGVLRLPAQIQVGFGVRAQIPRLLAAHADHVLVIADPFLVGTPVFTQMCEAVRAAGVELHVHSEVAPELPVESLTAIAEVAARRGVGAILAVGGGSALDAAKLVAVLLTHGGPLSRYYGENLVPGPVLPIIAVPTTAGTGSEVTPVAVVSDPERGLKIGVSSPHLVPVAAIVDPELALGAPASVTAFAGIDALVHAVESYTAGQLPRDPDEEGELPVFTGRNVLTEALSLEASGRIRRWLPVAVSTPGHRRARAEMAVASLQAGIAFGPTGTHLSHALQYPLGALTKTPHGLGTGLLLPYVLDVLREDVATAARIETLGAAMGVTGGAAGVVRSLAALNAEIGVPGTLADIGISESQLPTIAELALDSVRLISICPIPVDHALLVRILRSAHAGRLTESALR
ncbi:iron-containing alcohol dehydrogenase [Microbacterium sp. dk485]|nr:iron-containing alcohol dehydrogenase [Microbacterium sp. dk485]TXK16077.1 iron-containing alcohol dehydrogenase [Microbacterium wangchenii]